MLKKLLRNVPSNIRTEFIAEDRSATRHVVVLSQLYPPEPHMFSPDVAAAVSKHGHQVSVVTGFPNRPGGKLHRGYKQRFNYSELMSDIVVHRVPLIISHSRKALERIANFLSFSLSALTATSVVRNADVVYVYATPATAGIPAQIWRKLYGIPYVLHVQDLWPESVTDSGMLGKGWINKTAGTMLNLWLKRLYGNANELIAISPGMKQLLIDRGHRAEHCTTVYNWAEEDTIQVKSTETFGSDSLRLLYAGNLGPMQDLETVIRAGRKFDGRSDFYLNIAGEGVLGDVLQSAAEGAPNIKFLGNLSSEDIAQQYLEADFQLVTLKDVPIFRTTIPSKLQSSLAAGVPVITTVQGDVSDLIIKHNAGIVAAPENPDSLLEAFVRAYEMTATQRAQMGLNARKLYEETMSHEASTERIVSVLNKVTHQNAYKVLVEETS